MLSLKPYLNKSTLPRVWEKCKLGNALEGLRGTLCWSSLQISQRDQMLCLHVITYCQCPERYSCPETSCQEVWRRMPFQTVQCFIVNSYKSAQKMSTVLVLRASHQQYFDKSRLPDTQTNAHLQKVSDKHSLKWTISFPGTNSSNRRSCCPHIHTKVKYSEYCEQEAVFYSTNREWITWYTGEWASISEGGF